MCQGCEREKPADPVVRPLSESEDEDCNISVFAYYPTNGFLETADEGSIEIFLFANNFKITEKCKRFRKLFKRSEDSLVGFIGLLGERGELGENDGLYVDDLPDDEHLYLRVGRRVEEERVRERVVYTLDEGGGMVEKKGEKVEVVPWIERSNLYRLDVETGQVSEYCGDGIDYLVENANNWVEFESIESSEIA